MLLLNFRKKTLQNNLCEVLFLPIVINTQLKLFELYIVIKETLITNNSTF